MLAHILLPSVRFEYFCYAVVAVALLCYCFGIQCGRRACFIHTIHTYNTYMNVNKCWQMPQNMCKFTERDLCEHRNIKWLYIFARLWLPCRALQFTRHIYRHRCQHRLGFMVAQQRYGMQTRTAAPAPVCFVARSLTWAAPVSFSALCHSRLLPQTIHIVHACICQSQHVLPLRCIYMYACICQLTRAPTKQNAQTQDHPLRYFVVLLACLFVRIQNGRKMYLKRRRVQRSTWQMLAHAV